MIEVSPLGDGLFTGVLKMNVSVLQVPASVKNQEREIQVISL